MGTGVGAQRKARDINPTALSDAGHGLDLDRRMITRPGGQRWGDGYADVVDRHGVSPQYLRC